MIHRPATTELPNGGKLSIKIQPTGLPNWNGRSNLLLSSTPRLMSGVEAAGVLSTAYPSMDFSLKDLIFLGK
jgi:hypothetical protein